MFGWCLDGDHKSCIRKFEGFYFRNNRPVNSGEIIKCDCTKKGCKCNENE